jgi:hypothetical protein
MRALWQALFLVRALRKWLFFRVSRARDLHPRAMTTAATPKSDIEARVENAAILVAKSTLSACSVNGKRPAQPCRDGSHRRQRQRGLLLTRRESG